MSKGNPFSQWTKKDQEKFDRQEREMESYYQKDPLKEGCEPVLINLANIEKPLFTVKDIIVAMIGKGWIGIETLLDDLTRIGVDGACDMSIYRLEGILKELEEKEIVAVHWDTLMVAREF